MAYIKTFARVVSATGVADGVCRDPDDDKFLNAALSSGATVTVSNDHDRQVLSEYQGVKVLSPRAFAESSCPTPQRAHSSSRMRRRTATVAA